MNLKKAAEAQRRLSSRFILKWDGREVNLVAGADFGYGYKEKKIGASAVVFKMPDLEIVEISEAVREIGFPYLPGQRFGSKQQHVLPCYSNCRPGPCEILFL